MNAQPLCELDKFLYVWCRWPVQFYGRAKLILKITATAEFARIALSCCARTAFLKHLCVTDPGHILIKLTDPSRNVAIND